MFVSAEINGKPADNIFVLPRSTLYKDEFVLVVGEGDNLQTKQVGILKHDGDSVIVNKGLDGTERICLSPPEVFSDGMMVRVASE